jgi:hypothetical protein
VTTTQLLIVCLTCLALAAIAAGVLIHRARLVDRARAEDLAPRRVGHRVTVHTKKPDDQTIFGVVAGDYLDRLVLEHAEYVTPLGAQPIPGARHEIETRDIAWVDVHGLVTVAPAAPALDRADEAAA